MSFLENNVKTEEAIPSDSFLLHPVYNDSADTSLAMETRQDKLVIALALMLMCFFEIRTLSLIQAAEFPREVYGAWGILHGIPEWRVYQSRLLGPSLVEALSRVTKQPFDMAYRSVMSFLVALPTVIMYFIVRRLTKRSSNAMAAAGAFAVTIVALQDMNWFYLWDAIDFTTMLLFAYAVFFGKNDLRLLVPLFIVELLNRESAAFIAFWIIVSSFTPFFVAGTLNGLRHVRWTQAAIGAFLLVGGSWWTETIRKAMFKHSFVPQINLDKQHGYGPWFTLTHNLQSFGFCLDIQATAIALLINAGLGCLLYLLVVKQGRAAYPVVLLLSTMALSIWLFGYIEELRVWLDFVPFAILFLFTGLYNGAPSSNSATPKFTLID